MMSVIKAVVVGEPMITAFLFQRVDADKVANTLKISQKLFGECNHLRIQLCQPQWQ